jgi:hypothetical protein
MNRDESAVRELLLAAQQQPELLDTRQVLTQGRRRLWRKRVAPVVGLVLVAALAGGMVVMQPQHGPPGVTSAVPVVPGEIERLDVSEMAFGVAAQHKEGKTGLFLVVFLPNGSGGWSEVTGGGVIDQPVPPPTILLGNTQFPRVTFAALPAGSTSINAVFSGNIDFQVNAVNVRGADGHVYVVVAVVTATPAEAARILGLTWVDDQGHGQRYMPYGG